MPDSAPATPRPPVHPLVGRPLALFFRAVVAARNASFDAGLRVQRMPIPVISVGNLSVGGTGKTPMVRWVVEALREMGRTPCIAMRGYARRPGQQSDEETEHRARLPGVSLAVGAERERALRELLGREPGVDCAVLDDGFQRRTMGRNLDIVLLDATRSPFADRCLPAGWLREPVSALRRAGAIVVTHAEAAPADAVARLADQAVRIAPRAVLAIARHAWSALDVVGGSFGAGAEQPVEWLKGRRIHSLCAIGNPSAFLALARTEGAVIASADLRRDHSLYTPGDVDAATDSARASGAEAILTTAKDWVKLAPLVGCTAPIAWVRPRLDLRFDSGEASLRDALSRACAITAPHAPRPGRSADPRASVLR